MKEIAFQLELGAEGLAEDDRFLLECNFNELTTIYSKQQEYWILAIQVAREACCLRTMAPGMSQCRRHGTTEW